MLTLDPPVLVSVTLCAWVEPNVTLPKSWLLGFNVIWPAATPVPASERFEVVFDASLLTETVPVNGPAALGVNLTLKETLCPAAMTTGRLGAVREKYLVDSATLLIVTGCASEFAAVTVSVLLLPKVTLPKLRLDAPNERLPVCCWLEEELAALKPWQPTSRLRQASNSKVAAALVGLSEEIFLASCILRHEPLALTPLRIWTPGGWPLQSRLWSISR